MTSEDISRMLNVRDASDEPGAFLFDFLVHNDLANGIELKHSNSLTTVYLAAAANMSSRGHLLSVTRSLDSNKRLEVDRSLAQLGLADRVTQIREPRSFNWRLMKLLEKHDFDNYEFCFIEGCHTWHDAGFAYCLVERLIRPGGWIILNNLRFTFRESSLRDRPWVRMLPEEEQVTRQISQVFNLLMRPDPCFDNFRCHGPFAFARKCKPMWTKDAIDNWKLEHLICDIVERARSDPDFRELLLHSHAEAISSMNLEQITGLDKLEFVDTDSTAPVPQERKNDGTLTIFLDTLAGESSVDEEHLQRLLNEAKATPNT